MTEQNGQQALPATRLSESPTERLPEPDLSYYRTLRGLFEGAQLQMEAHRQGLQAFLADVQAKRGYQGDVQIDREGWIHRPTPAETPAPAAPPYDVRAPWVPEEVNP